MKIKAAFYLLISMQTLIVIGGDEQERLLQINDASASSYNAKGYGAIIGVFTGVAGGIAGCLLCSSVAPHPCVTNHNPWANVILGPIGLGMFLWGFGGAAVCTAAGAAIGSIIDCCRYRYTSLSEQRNVV